MQFSTFSDCTNVLFRIQDVDICIGLDVRSGYRCRTLNVDFSCLFAITVHLQSKLLDVQDDLGNILENPIDCGELVEHAVNLNA